jgi:adenylate cyclase
VLPLVKPVAAMALSYGGVLLARAVAAERERRWLRTAFGHYLAPTVLEQVLGAPHKLRLGGERRHMTVLFSDVAGFTSFSEKLEPEEVGALLNAYLDRMTACVAQTGGTLDKFVGDAVMAEWNAPLAQPDHAARACETALHMLEEVGREGAAWRAAGGVLDIRIGINTGEMVVGNMGSHQIFDYTVIGNEVNTASRLEPLNKAFGTRIIVAAATCREAEAQRPGRFAFRPLGRVMPKGRAAPLDIYELAGWREALDEEACQRLGAFAEAMAHYLERRFGEALRLFRGVPDGHSQHGPAALFASLCEEYLAHPPAEDWNCVYVQTEK